MQKDMRAVTTPVTAPIAKEPLKMPKKTPTDLKKAEASNVCVLAPAGWYAIIDLQTKDKTQIIKSPDCADLITPITWTSTLFIFKWYACFFSTKE